MFVGPLQKTMDMTLIDENEFNGGPQRFRLRGASIEVCCACNHRCIYCPVATSPHPQRVMDLPLFSKAIQELNNLGKHLRRISFNHYNEPFSDPLLVDRIEIAVEYRFFDVVLLNTNLSVLPLDEIERLLIHKERIEFNVNLPVTDRDKYHSLHGRDHFDRVKSNLEMVVAHGFSVRVNVQQSLLNSTEFDTTTLPVGVKVEMIRSNSRAGLIEPLTSSLNFHKVLRGCSINRPTSYVHIGVDGTVFFCCEDYWKQYQIGNIAERPLSEILRSERMRTYLSYLTGESTAPENFLCRSCELAIGD